MSALVDQPDSVILCRCCMSEQPPLFDLFELNLELVLAAVANVIIEPNDGLPTLACSACIKQAKVSLKFKEQCERADRTMRRLFYSCMQPFPQEESETELHEYDATASVGSDGEEQASVQTDETSRPFDHGYSMAFDEGSIEMLDECLALEEQYLEEETSTVEEHSLPLETLDESDAREGYHPDESTDDTDEDSESNAKGAMIYIDTVDELPEIVDCRASCLPTDNTAFHRKEKSHYCDACGIAFSLGLELRRHQRLHCISAPFHCPSVGCGRRFRCKELLKMHMNTHSTRSVLQRKRSQQQKVGRQEEARGTSQKLCCKLCGRLFLYKSFLRRHSQICKGRTEFDFVRDVVDHYTDEEFRKHFRMDRVTVDSLVDSFSRSTFYRVRTAGGRQEISARAQFLSFLWFCGKNTSFGKVCREFQFAMASFHKHMNLILDFLHQLAPAVIRFPESDDEKVQLALQFAEIAEVTNVIGCIDSCFIDCVRYGEKKGQTNPLPNAIPLAKGAQAAAESRNNPGCGIVLQAISDSSGKFLDVSTDLMLATDHDDGQLFAGSAIAHRLDAICQSGRFHLLGSAPYPLRSYLLTPFAVPATSNLSSKTATDPKVVTRFNETLEQALENTVVAAFRMLKRRFPVLIKLRFFSHEKMGRFVLACCVLHNVCIDAGDVLVVDEESREPVDVEEYSDEVRFWQRPYRERSADGAKIPEKAGKAKRDKISSLLASCLLQK